MLASTAACGRLPLGRQPFSGVVSKQESRRRRLPHAGNTAGSGGGGGDATDELPPELQVCLEDVSSQTMLQWTDTMDCCGQEGSESALPTARWLSTVEGELIGGGSSLDESTAPALCHPMPQGLCISEDGQYLIDSATGKVVNEFGATRFDVAVRGALAGAASKDTPCAAGLCLPAVCQTGVPQKRQLYWTRPLMPHLPVS